MNDENPASAATERYGPDLFCPDCQYSLRGLESDRCPECGLHLGFISSGESIIPWERSAELGVFQAFWRTVFTRHRVLCRAVYAPVSLPAARAFQCVCVAHWTLATLTAFALAFGGMPPPLVEAAEATAPWFVALCGACCVLWVLVCTSLPAALVRGAGVSVEMKNRAATLTLYGSAPLTAAWAAPPLVLLTLGFDWLGFDAAWFAPLIAALALAPLIFCWLQCRDIAGAALPRSPSKALVTWVSPALALFAGGVLLIVGPLCVLFGAVVFYSLR